MNRRSILGALGVAPFASKAIAETAVGGVIGSGANFGGPQGLGAATQAGVPNPPLIDHATALQKIFADKQAMDEIREELFEEHRVVHAIDPDIMVMRSWSEMAKITFQRQRNVERDIAKAFGSGDWNKPQRYIRALVTRLDKIMWSRS